MRKTALSVVATATLTLGLLSPPGVAHAAAASYVVRGHPITAPGLRLIGDSCTTAGAASPTVTFLERQGGTVGSSALGYSVNQASSEAGPAAMLNGDPTTIHTASVDVYAPTGTSGHAYAWLPAGVGGYYVGWRSFSVPAGQWIDNNLVNVTYTWSYYNAQGEFVHEYDTPRTIQAWAVGEGATVAELGVLLGCGGEQFYVDGLTLANAANSVSYDFEAAAPPPTPPPPAPEQHHVAHLEWSTDGKNIRTSDRLVVRYGQRLWMLGHGHTHSSSGLAWYSGVGTMTAERTRGGQVSIGRKAFDPDYYASYRVQPKEETTYRFTADAQGGLPASASNQVTVLVRSKVGASVVDRHLIEGQQMKVRGRVLPGKKGVKVTLQRKVGRKWTNLESSRTARRGVFALATKVRKPGAWVVRVKVGATLTNLGTATKASKVRVDRYVPPPAAPPSAPPPAPAQDNTPETSAPVVTVAAPQVTTTAPPPPAQPTPAPAPDRPTPTGRTQTVVGAETAAGARTGTALPDK